MPTFATAAGGQQKHAAHPTENVKIFMRTYLNSLAKKLLKSEKKTPKIHLRGLWVITQIKLGTIH